MILSHLPPPPGWAREQPVDHAAPGECRALGRTTRRPCEHPALPLDPLGLCHQHRAQIKRGNRVDMRSGEVIENGGVAEIVPLRPTVRSMIGLPPGIGTSGGAVARREQREGLNDNAVAVLQALISDPNTPPRTLLEAINIALRYKVGVKDPKDAECERQLDEEIEAIAIALAGELPASERKPEDYEIRAALAMATERQLIDALRVHGVEVEFVDDDEQQEAV